MRRTLTLAVLAVLAGGLATPAYAQKQAPAVTRDSDRDGVPDNRDRCRNTPAGTRVDATGCPAPAGQAQAAPAGQAATPPGGAPAAAAPTGAPATVVQPQAQAGGAQAQPPPGQAAAAGGRPAATGPAGGAAAGQPAPAAGQPTAAPAAGTTGQAAATPAAGRPATPVTGQPAAPAATQPAATAPTQPAAPAAGQPAAAPTTGQAAQTGASRQPAAAQPGAGGAAGATLGAAAPATQPARGAPAPAAPSGQPAALAATPPISIPALPPTNPTNTAGFWMPAYTGRSAPEMLEYARALAIKIDTAIVSLVEVFRNTSGAPMVGATGPSVLSTREKTRWERCRLIHYDLLTFADAATFLKDSLTSPPALVRAIAALDEGLQDLQATSACDDVVSMIEAPDRWAPWEQNYANTARNFYRDWYTQLRAVHEADRGLARSLNLALPAARQFPIPTGLPPNPPTIGAAR